MSILNLPKQVLDNFDKSLLNITTIEELIFVKDKEKQILVVKKAVEDKATIKELRHIISIDNDSLYDYNGQQYGLPNKDSIIEVDSKSKRSFDKAITTLKMASNKMVEIIVNIEDNWVVYEMLLQYKSVLNNQIDILLKEKKNFNNNYFIKKDLLYNSIS